MPLKFPPLSIGRKNINLKTLSLVFLLFAAALTSYLRIFDSYESILLDLRFRFRPVQSVSDKIVLIEISDDTLKQLGYWPLPRDFHAKLIDILSTAGARQIMFDLILTDSTQTDDILSESIQKAGNVYLPYVFRLKDERLSGKIPEAAGQVAALLPKFSHAVKGTCYINSFKDVDGKTRRAPLFVNFHGRMEPHIALRMIGDDLGLPLKEIVFRGNTVHIDGKLILPVFPGGSMLINYAGTWKETFRHYSYVDILASGLAKNEGKTPRISLEDFKDTICFVGLTATGTPDLQPMPLENNYPMVGLHANLINSILLNRFTHRAGQGTNLALLLILLFLVVRATRHYKSLPAAGFGATVGMILLFVLASLMIFDLRGLWIDVFYPAVMMILTNTGMSIFNFLEESRKRELIEKELSIAKTIQESFLPAPLAGFQTLEIASSMLTAKHVGGDLYDMHELGKYKLGVFIGDVSGKGVPAALVMAKTISLFRMLAAGTDEPSDLLFQLNEEMTRSANSGIFVTATYIVYIAGQKRVMISSAGHLPTFILRKKKGTIESLTLEGGMPLGLMERVEFSQSEVTLEEGDSIILYTDGVVEAKNLKREDFGEEKLKSTLIENRDKKPQETLEIIQKAFQAFAGKAPQHDDCTVIILKEQG